jgi:hypothetical protein
MTRSKSWGHYDVNERRRRIMRAANTMATTRYDCTGKERVQRTALPVTLPRLKCLDESENDDDERH